ncbi:16S rRNA (adenine(1518)-N(6)/adenine(1519)-N(6))-dimethyltransferase RsmA [Candidatus Saccharibacteria bacterium]|nr:16S rRNA (adenine(1518)-N(6)/adenine(1519)-N(6))-dimethyltransferase RsmA [Candidatus Saccharibacteria bacterium]
MAQPRKSLGQHWLKDRTILADIVDFAGVTSSDTVLEIGPGQGYLTSMLLGVAKQVVAVEIDADLAKKLPGQFPGKNLEVITGDFLAFDLRQLPAGYKVVANIPYYITAAVVRTLLTAANKPTSITLLVQKEVAERLAAKPGDMSVLAISAQFYANVTLGFVVQAKYFTPPPKINSQLVRLTISRPFLEREFQGMALKGLQDEKEFFKLVRVGFSNKRKKLVSNLAVGYQIDKQVVETLFAKLGLSPEIRAQDLSLDDWQKLYKNI